MAITSVFAAIAVANLEAASLWYEKLFGRPADDAPMDGLVEWYLSDQHGIQVFRDESRAGKSSATLGVSSLDEQLAALEAVDISAGPIVGTPDVLKASTVTDNEGNQVTFVEDLTKG